MSDAIVRFDPNTLKDRISDRIKNSFVELVPEDAWKALVQAELDKFFKPQFVKHGYNDVKEEPSELSKIISAEIRERLMKAVEIELDKPEYQDKWNSGLQKNVGGDFANAVCKELTNELVSSLFNGIVQSAVQRLRSELQNGRSF
jgi:hypothetical protein